MTNLCLKEFRLCFQPLQPLWRLLPASKPTPTPMIWRALFGNGRNSPRPRSVSYAKTATSLRKGIPQPSMQLLRSRKLKPRPVRPPAIKSMKPRRVMKGKPKLIPKPSPIRQADTALITAHGIMTKPSIGMIAYIAETPITSMKKNIP